MSVRAVHLKISGRVQGVGFRYYAQKKARLLNLSGWVKNCPDGSVEAYCEGEEADLVSYIKWAAQGPPSAHVTSLEKRYTSPKALHSGFSVEY